MSETCGHENPKNSAQTCDKPPHPYGAHMHRDSLSVWSGVPMPQRTRGAKGDRVKEIVKVVRESGRADRTGPPGGPPASAANAWHREREQWLKEATEALRTVCETNETFTNKEVWARVDDTQERRAMVIVVRTGIRNGWMEEESAMRVRDTWSTRDGVEFPLNKLVPVYRSKIFAGSVTK